MLLTTICLVLLFSSSLAFVPESGSNRERLDGCSSSSINAASLHFTKVGQIKSHSGYIHLASKSNVSVLPHMVIRACSMLVDLKQLELFKKVENDHNRNNLSVKRKSLQSGHYDRVLQLMSNRCISTLDRTVDVLELYFNSFSHGGDETHIAEHKTNVLRAQMKFARTYRDVIGLSQKDRRPSLKDRNKPYSRRFRNKKDLNSTMQQDWLGCSAPIFSHLAYSVRYRATLPISSRRYILCLQAHLSRLAAQPATQFVPVSQRKYI